jgi:transketolase
VWTHDAFRVGEDGPTHQPVEQEAQIRLMEKLKNHHGQNSMLVASSCRCQRNHSSMENGDGEYTSTPTALILIATEH